MSGVVEGPQSCCHRERVVCRRGARPGFSFLDVALATVIISVGTLFAGQFMRGIFDVLDPKGSSGGLRRELMVTELLQAQAEALRAVRVVPTDAGSARLVSPPEGSGYTVTVVPRLVSPTSPQLMYYDISVSHGGRVQGSLTVSTLRGAGDPDEKIGF